MSNKSTCPSLVTLPDKHKLFWQQNKTAKVHQTINVIAVKVKVNSAVSICRDPLKGLEVRFTFLGGEVSSKLIFISQLLFDLSLVLGYTCQSQISIKILERESEPSGSFRPHLD